MTSSWEAEVASPTIPRLYGVCEIGRGQFGSGSQPSLLQ